VNDLNHTPSPDPLDEATAALRNTAVPPGPPADLVAGTVVALQSRSLPVVPAPTPAQLRRRRMIRYISYGTATAAAVGLLVVAGVLGTAGKAPAAELAEALDNVNNAKSFKHVTKMTMDGKTMFEMTMYKQGERWRFEAGKDVAIVVDKDGNAVQFDHAAKTATKLDIEAMKKDRPKASEEVEAMAKKVRELKGDGVRRLGEETLDGKKTTAYAFADVTLAGEKTDWKVWVDAKRKLPVRMEMTKGNDGAAFVVTSGFSDWDEEFDAKLFSLDAPLGYTWAAAKK